MTDEEKENWALIMTPAGEEWSGRARYAAAMYFYRKGALSADVLEIYRICSRIDHEDAIDALKAYKMGEAWISKVQEMRTELAKAAKS
jgi:hypothetical protein